MMPWFLWNSERLARERTGIEDLSQSADWLIGAAWGLGDDLYLDAVIRAHAYDYEVRVTFPFFFPEAPIVVRPRNLTSRISSHQYGGADGPLCLEWGPDNWHPDITAVQMLESTHRLFEFENPLGLDRPEFPVVAPSRHKLTIGQELRSEKTRCYYSSALRDFYVGQPENSIGSLRFSYRKLGPCLVILIHEAMPLEGEIWRDTTIPSTIPETGQYDLFTGIWFKTSLDTTDIKEPNNISELTKILEKWNAAGLLAQDGTSPIKGFDRVISGVLVVDRNNVLHLFIVFSKNDVISCALVCSESDPIQLRSPEIDILNDKSIGIVGLGSAGSKIAISLARMGVRKFYLVDHDLLLPENLQRHALDWQSVTLHKVDAMANALSQISPNIQVEVSRIHLTGQESNAAISGVMNRLGKCDLLIDATAVPRVFNLLASVSQIAAKPMIWMEVFGGGIGGLVARSCPGVDPHPQAMRGAYLHFCTEHPAPVELMIANDYSLEGPAGVVLTASDSDISVIAHHATRFVPDCFTKGHSTFPYSMYLVGLKRAWVFEAPFSTIPISTAFLPMTHSGDSSEELGAETKAFLLELLRKGEDEPSATS